MKLLLDTHALLWFLEGSGRLGGRARDAIEDLSNTRFFSVASAWEMAIRVSLGKLSLSVPFDQLVPGQLLANGIDLLPVAPEHIASWLDSPTHTVRAHER